MSEESKLKSKILKDLRSYKQMVCFKIMKCSDNKIPDIFFTSVLTGPCFLEIKKPGEKPDKGQLHMIGRLNICGAKALWTDNWPHWVSVKKILNLSHETLV
jgi:hypothetical protein